MHKYKDVLYILLQITLHYITLHYITLHCGMDRVKQLEIIQHECKKVFEKKNNDYGDAFARHGTVGVLVRIADKMSRFTNISKNSLDISVSDETLRDTLMDLHNYSAMAIMCMDDQISMV